MILNAPFGRMLMCHMIADTTEELMSMADRIGVARKWVQDAGTTREHFDIALSKKRLAIQYGAIKIEYGIVLGEMLKQRGRGTSNGSPENKIAWSRLDPTPVPPNQCKFRIPNAQERR
jgi:Protein of unknown function (DUF4031)